MRVACLASPRDNPESDTQSTEDSTEGHDRSYKCISACPKNGTFS